MITQIVKDLLIFPTLIFLKITHGGRCYRYIVGFVCVQVCYRVLHRSGDTRGCCWQDVLNTTLIKKFLRWQTVSSKCFTYLLNANPAVLWQPNSTLRYIFCCLRASSKAASALSTLASVAFWPITPILQTLPAEGPSPPAISTLCL